MANKSQIEQSALDGVRRGERSPSLTSETPDQSLAKWIRARLDRCLPMDAPNYDQLIALAREIAKPRAR